MSNERPILHDAIEQIQTWKTALPATPQPIDAHGPTRFRLADGARLAVLGDAYCAALIPALERAGAHVEISEAGPPWLSAERKSALQYGMQSARCGRLETPLAVAQALERAVAGDAVQAQTFTVDGRLFDPCWDVSPEGYDDLGALRAEHDAHRTALNEVLERADVLLVVLGGVEAWRLRSNGAVVQCDPIVRGLPHDACMFAPCTFDESVAALRTIVRIGRGLNPKLRCLFAVSPSPVIATLEPTHVLQADRIAKSRLRLAIDVVRAEDEGVEYVAILEAFDATGFSGTVLAPERSAHPAFLDPVARAFVQRFGAYTGERADNADAASYERRLCDEDELRVLMAREFDV